MTPIQTILRAPLAWAVSLLTALLLAGCADTPAPENGGRPPPPPVAHVYQQPAPPPPSTNVYAYPLHGQPPAQQDRDHYECSLWATQQTGFDPSAPGVPPQHQVHIVTGPPPGSGTAAGVVTGTILGAAIGGPYHGPGPAIAGAIVGGVIGTAAESSARQTQTVTVTDQRAAAAIAQKAGDYRRAISACLDARGYSVK
jgi:outer membrane lipoprotein SlyB